MAARALLNVGTMVAAVFSLHRTFRWLAVSDFCLYWFLALFTWRYLRLVINLVGFWCYSPAPEPSKPTYLASRDVTAVLPTVDPQGRDFRETLESCADNAPAKVIVVTAGDELFAQTSAVVGEFIERYPLTQFIVKRTQVASKRAQVALAVPYIQTDIVVVLDDHVFWGPRYLETLLRAFEDPAVGLVGTNKRVVRDQGLNLWGRTWNMLGATYLYRHNFEIRATNAIDGGVFVVSGRTCAIRAQILRHPEFLRGYTNEKFFFGMLGPLNPDDDNYNTRFVVRHGWKVKIQYTEDSVMKTRLGVENPLHTKFLGQCRRWARTTWRSNLCSLVTDRTVWSSQPYCVYAVYLTSLTNFAAVTDPLLVYLFTHSSACTSHLALAGLVCWILFTKIVKVFDYFRRHPQDIFLFPLYLVFGYFHSLIKLWALLTFWDCTWSGRRLDKIKVNHNNTPGDLLSKPPLKVGNHHSNDDDHPHITTLRSIRARIAELHTQHGQHMASYHQPLLSELQLLRGSFVALQADHDAIYQNQDAIRSELREVVSRAEAMATAQVTASSDEADIVAAIAEIKSAVAGVEERWRGSIEKSLREIISV
ncbi:glycosyltransferase [Chaetomidium leptoderma]|uniref:Glycosyltransferase n=1 Tax=Chaetomidium leptoderma TaxID=669021 RepID=A0AAN6ZUR3_9PEZI|nr:glycosyltransferase [Chaetomidium leptoderma]